jgi:hypothetical protein
MPGHSPLTALGVGAAGIVYVIDAFLEIGGHARTHFQRFPPLGLPRCSIPLPLVNLRLIHDVYVSIILLEWE